MLATENAPRNKKKRHAIIEPNTVLHQGGDAGAYELSAILAPATWLLFMNTGWIDFRLFLLYAYFLSVLLCLLDRKYWDFMKYRTAAATTLCPPAYFYMMGRNKSKKWGKAVLSSALWGLSVGFCLLLEWLKTR